MNVLTPEVEARFHGLRRIIGNTPLLAIDYSFRGKRRRLFAKSENLNMTGSVKDRMALHILHKAYETGAIEPGSLIIEATSGNTGIAFAAVGAALGHPVSIFMPDWMSKERKNLLKSFGATLHPVSAEEGGFVGSITKSEELAAATPGSFLPRQFANEDNSSAHEESTGPEIHYQLGAHGLRPHAFVAGVGTGGTVMGVGRFLRAHHPGVRIHPLEPSNSPTLRTGCRVGGHRIQGVSDEFIPPIVKLDELDGIIDVDDGDAIRLAQKLARRLGLGVGISSGANFIGAVMLQDELGDDAIVVTIFCDSNKKYLSTDLMKDEPVKDGHLEPVIDLHGFTAYNRSCQMCDVSEDLLRMAGG
ncbi:MAG: PLP-dependent cysteine synthase family protein [Planctomycetota bacterium]|jgi:cysteine synthase A